MVQRRWLGLAVIATALASVGCGPKQVGGVWFVSGPSGESVVVTAGSLGGAWLRRHSLEDGTLRASAQLFVAVIGRNGYTAQCTPAVPGRLWCLENGNGIGDGHGLRIRDMESLRVIAEQEEMLGRTPALARERPLRAGSVDPKTHGFSFESRDGYRWIIDPTTLVPSRFDGIVDSGPKLDVSPPWSGCNGNYNVGSDCYDFTPGKRKALVRNGVVLHVEHTYLEARFGPQVEDWPRVLVVEHVLDQGPTLWCLFLDGTVAWKVTNFNEKEWTLEVGPAKLYRDTVVFVTSRRLIALRQQDGAVVWTSPP